MYNWNTFFCVQGYKRVSNFRGDYLKSWFLHGERFAVGLFFGEKSTSIEINFKTDDNDYKIAHNVLSSENLKDTLHFLEAINDKSLLPLYINFWGKEIVSAYFASK